jgi:2-methylcitrate dehydratase PrpD
MALGIATFESRRPPAKFGTMTKAASCWSSRTQWGGSSTACQPGFTADPQSLEGRFGFFNTFVGPGEFELETVLQDFSAPYEIISPGIGVKPYPACRQTHRAIDSMLDLVHPASAPA